MRDADIENWTVAKEFNTKSFHDFPRLPQELQDIIWGFALLGPCILTVDVNLPFEREEPDFKWESMAGQEWLTFNKAYHSPNPALLRTCQRSRAIASKTYKLLFGSSNVFADLDKDILYFVESEAIDYEDYFLVYEVFDPIYCWDRNNPLLADPLKVSHILLGSAIQIRYSDRGCTWELRDNVQEFSNLRKISFLTSPDPFFSRESGQLEICKIDPGARSDGEEGLEDLAEELRQRFHYSAFQSGPEESMTKKEVFKQTSERYETQLVALKRRSDYELWREQEFRTGKAQENEELYISQKCSKFNLLLTGILVRTRRFCWLVSGMLKCDDIYLLTRYLPIAIMLSHRILVKNISRSKEKGTSTRIHLALHSQSVLSKGLLCGFTVSRKGCGRRDVCVL